MSYEYLTQLPRGGSDDYVPPPPGAKQSTSMRARVGTMRRGGAGAGALAGTLAKAGSPPASISTPVTSPPGSGGVPGGALTEASPTSATPVSAAGETLAGIGAALGPAPAASEGGAAEEGDEAGTAAEDPDSSDDEVDPLNDPSGAEEGEGGGGDELVPAADEGSEAGSPPMRHPLDPASSPPVSTSPLTSDSPPSPM